MFCEKCGFEIPKGMKFCTNCGNKVNQPPENLNLTKDVPSNSRQFEPRQKKTFKLPSNLKWWHIVLIAVSAVSVITVIVAATVNSKKKQTPTDNSHAFDYSSASSASSEEDNAQSETESADSREETPSQDDVSQEIVSENTAPAAESEPTEPQDIPFNYDDITEAIRALNCYSDIGVACSHFADREDHTDELWDYLSEDQKEWGFGVYKLDCCKSVAQAEAHYRKYFSDAFIASHPFARNNLIENSGNLYCAGGAKGSVQYNFARPDLPIRRETYNRLYVNVEQITAVDTTYVTVYLEYQNGVYKIVSVDE